jgi:hypothetical protein
VNTFNRIVMVLGTLICLAAVSLVVLLPLDAVKVARVSLDEFERMLYDGGSYTMFLAAAGGTLFLLLVALVLELRRPRRRFVRIKTQGRGNAQLDVESITQSLEYRVDELAGVRQVRTRIKSRGKSVDVALDLDTSPSVNIPVLTEQVVNLAQDIVEEQLGLAIHGQVRVNIKHEPYPRGTMPVSTPQERDASARAALVEPVLPRAERVGSNARTSESKPVVVPVGGDAPAKDVSTSQDGQGDGDGDEPKSRW